jgi:hypothetical protein
VLLEQGEGDIRIRADAGVKYTHGEEGTGLDVLLRGVRVLVDLVDTCLRVPKHAESQRRRSTHHSCKVSYQTQTPLHTVVLVLVDPALAFRSIGHELVVTESGIHEAVHKSRSKVGTGGIDVGQCF